MEDYEYLWLLRDLTDKLESKKSHLRIVRESKRLLERCKKLTIPKERNLEVDLIKEWIEDPTKLYSLRKTIASQIEKLNSIISPQKQK